MMFFAKANTIIDESAFGWWVRFAIKKQVE